MVPTVPSSWLIRRATLATRTKTFKDTMVNFSLCYIVISGEMIYGSTYRSRGHRVGGVGRGHDELHEVHDVVESVASG